MAGASGAFHFVFLGDLVDRSVCALGGARCVAIAGHLVSRGLATVLRGNYETIGIWERFIIISSPRPPAAGRICECSSLCGSSLRRSCRPAI